jgi:perosamine synthetase
MSGCDYLVPQKVPTEYTHSYYTLGVIYEGQESIGVSWEDFRKAYVEAGGDGIYGAWSVPYLEPMVAERRFANRCPGVYEKVSYPQGLCPVAEKIQPKIMQFKTNYRDTTIAEKKADILKKVIRKFAGR